jgi:hypothetical protein
MLRSGNRRPTVADLTLPPGAWWKLPLLLGPVQWLALPPLIYAATFGLGALGRGVEPLAWLLAYPTLAANLLAEALAIASYAFFPVLVPSVGFAAWLLRRGRLSWWIWGPGVAAFAAAVGVLLGLLLEGPNEAGVVSVVALVAAACGLVHGLAFRGLVQAFLRLAAPA